VSSIAIASVFLGCSFGAALIGMILHEKLPGHHLQGNSLEVVKLSVGLIASMSALVLSLLIASASNSYNQQKNELNALAANIVLLDRTLEFYGSDAKAARDRLRDLVRQTHDRIWSPEGVRPEVLASMETQSSVRANVEQLLSLSPQTDLQRLMQGRAIQESDSIAQSRLLIIDQLGSAISGPFIMVLIVWTCMLFTGFGLLARNLTVAFAMFGSALTAAGAIFLLLELSDPYHGLMQISDEPLRNAMIQIDH